MTVSTAGLTVNARRTATQRARPGDDLPSGLVEARDNEERLTEPELIDLATQMLLAGHETTVSLIGTGIVLPMRHPDQLAALRADPKLIKPAVEGRAVRPPRPVPLPAARRPAHRDRMAPGADGPRPGGRPRHVVAT